MTDKETLRFSRCPLHHEACCSDMDRRSFLKQASILSAAVPVAAGALGHALAAAAVTAPAPAEKQPPVVKVGYLRYAKAVGGGWPGHGFNNDLACKEYSQKLEQMGRELNVRIDLADAEITDEAGVDRFVAAAKKQTPDALLICPIGLGQWDRAQKILGTTGMPTLIFSQIGTAFTWHTTPLASRPGVYLVSSLDIGDVRPGLEMVRTEKTLRQSTLLVVKGGSDEEKVYGSVGTRLKYVSEEAYVAAYQKSEVDDDVRRLAEEAVQEAKEIREVNRDDVLQAARHYFAAKRLLAEHAADGITSNCLGMLYGKTGTPCLGYSRLMDEGIPAGCEADVGSAMTMMLIHNLLGRPGFMADPLVDTARNLFANAHCNCPTRLDGFDGPREPYVLRAHHGHWHWVSPQVLWRIGQVFTLSRFQKPGLLIVDRAKVACNYESPPSAACITNVGSVVEGAEDNPHKVGGFHVLQIYGDHVAKLRAYGRLYGIEAVHAWDPRVSFLFEPDYPA
ncbi:MAG TPA: hypothetical protein VMY37_02635 [Thermoguttaceae bacterium]|nr:hypothetical protein [Thermoguttaceae bacterium]